MPTVNKRLAMPSAIQLYRKLDPSIQVNESDGIVTVTSELFDWWATDLSLLADEISLAEIDWRKGVMPESWSPECGHSKAAWTIGRAIHRHKRSEIENALREREDRRNGIRPVAKNEQEPTTRPVSGGVSGGQDGRPAGHDTKPVPKSVGSGIGNGYQSGESGYVGTASIKLRPFQQRIIPSVRADASKGVRRILLVGPTGMGKMVLSAFFLRSCAERGKRGVFVADQRELIGQSQDQLRRFGVECGVLMAGSDDYNDSPIYVVSKDTLHARAFRSKRVSCPPGDLLCVDEAHKSLAATWQDVIGHYDKAVIIGFTATPCRTDGRGLGDVWETMHIVTTYAELRELGYIVPLRIFASKDPDLHGVGVKNGDYVRRQLEGKMNTDVLVGDIVADWRRRAEGRLTIVFASGVQHSVHIRNQFRRAGLRWEHIDAKNTSQQERDDVLGKLRDGVIDGVSNYGILTTGIDIPPLSCMINARPTKSFGLWRQMAGRVLRASPETGKKDAILLDHGGAVYRHGFPDDDIEWELSATENVVEKAKAKRKRKCRQCGFQWPAKEGVICPKCKHDNSHTEPFVCPACACTYRGPECPECGHKPSPKERAVKMVAGELKEISRDKLNRETSKTDKEKFWKKCIGIAIHKNRTMGFAAHLYKDKFGVFPRGLATLPSGNRQWGMQAREFYQRVKDAEAFGVSLEDDEV